MAGRCVASNQALLISEVASVNDETELHDVTNFCKGKEFRNENRSNSESYESKLKVKTKEEQQKQRTKQVLKEEKRVQPCRRACCGCYQGHVLLYWSFAIQISSWPWKGHTVATSQAVFSLHLKVSPQLYPTTITSSQSTIWWRFQASETCRELLHVITSIRGAFYSPPAYLTSSCRCRGIREVIFLLQNRCEVRDATGVSHCSFNDIYIVDRVLFFFFFF